MDFLDIPLSPGSPWMLRKKCNIYLMRYPEAHHDVSPNPGQDPGLTDKGHSQAYNMRLPAIPDVILVSTNTCAIQTALAILRQVDYRVSDHTVSVEVMPELDEPNLALCYRPLRPAQLAAKFPQFDYKRLTPELGWAARSDRIATFRARVVRSLIDVRAAKARNVFVITHTEFLSYLVQGEKFNVGEIRAYRIASDPETLQKRNAVSWLTGALQDFGPRMLVPVGDGDLPMETSEEET